MKIILSSGQQQAIDWHRFDRIISSFSITGVSLTGGFIVSNKSAEGSNYEETRRLIKEWILEQKCKFTPIKDNITVWHLAVEYGTEFAFGVNQERQRPETVFQSVSIDFEEYRQRIDRMTAAERHDLVFALRFMLLGMDVQFNISGDNLEMITLSQQLFVADLTRTLFWSKVFALQKAVLGIFWTLERALPEPAAGVNLSNKPNGSVH